MARLSVIIPTLDEAACLRDLLQDLAGLRAAGHEVILIDGGSVDETLATAIPHVDQAGASALGRARQMNAGAARATGDWLWFLHADTRVPPGATDTLLAVTRHGPGWGRFDIELSGRDPRLRVVERAMNWRSRVTGIATGDQGIFVERALFDAAGGYPDIPLMEDITLSGRLRRLARPVCIRSPHLQTSSRRWESGGVVRTVWLMWRLRLAYALGASPDSLARRYL